MGKRTLSHGYHLDGLRRQVDQMARWQGVQNILPGRFVCKGGGGSSEPLWELRKSEHQGRKLTFKVLGNNGMQEIVIVGDGNEVVRHLKEAFAYKELK